MVCSPSPSLPCFRNDTKTIETCTSRSLAHLPYQNHAVDLLPSQMKIFSFTKRACLACYVRKEVSGNSSEELNVSFTLSAGCALSRQLVCVELCGCRDNAGRKSRLILGQLLYHPLFARPAGLNAHLAWNDYTSAYHSTVVQQVRALAKKCLAMALSHMHKRS